VFFPKTTTIANGIENREGEAGNRGLQRVFRRSLSGLLNAVRMSEPLTPLEQCEAGKKIQRKYFRKHLTSK